ncbi:unnamed protein product [Adineta ricciae]|uniref:DED domain-containing protein n=1 Tax=Adineta ricciae TaxID=249248 RepID=A0A814SPL1_ADIRI|nr:unnamed protein product [Adineta ricciae]CAF1148751.1 unnamed protein product [Adineta ricciae]
MDDSAVRSLILKLQDRLSDRDRECFHFYLGSTVPRRVRDDFSLSGNLRLMDTLFEQNKISGSNVSFLIQAFEEIKCYDAVNLLKEHAKKMRLNGCVNQSENDLLMTLPDLLYEAIPDVGNKKSECAVDSECDYTTVDVDSIHHHNLTNIEEISMIVYKTEMSEFQTRAKVKSEPNLKERSGKRMFWIIPISFLCYAVLLFYSVTNRSSISQYDSKLEQLEILEKRSADTLQLLRYRVKSIKNEVPSLRSSWVDIHPNATWSQSGLIVAGGHGAGSDVKQLDSPVGVYVDSDETIYVADRNNHRIAVWTKGADRGEIVVGGNKTHQLQYPYDVIFDEETSSVITFDGYLARAVRWFRQKGTSEQLLATNIDGRGGTMDDEGTLYISNGLAHEVRRYRIGDIQGNIVAGGHEQGNNTSQLNTPTCVFIDRNHSLYVSDTANHRVMKWEKGARQGTVVAGNGSAGNDLAQLRYPEGIVVDQLGTVYVSDAGNHRIMKWPKGAMQGTIIVDSTSRPYSISFPYGLAFDPHGNLYIAEHGHHRVQKFPIQQPTN